MTAVRRLGTVTREVLLLELALYRSLARWLVRRPDVPPGARPIRYDRLVVPMMWLWIFGSAVEVVVVEVVLRHVDRPWADTLRLPLLAVGVWGVLWMVGMLASHRVRPHLLDDSHLLVRSGARTFVRVPLREIGATRLVEHELPGLVRSLHVEGSLVLVGVSSRTNLELVLRSPQTLATSRGDLAAARVGLWVDEPRVVAAQLAGAGLGAG